MRESFLKTVTINPVTGLPYAQFSGMLYDTLEAPGDAPLTAEMVPYVVSKIRGDAVWLDVETITQSVIDTQNPASLSRRFWYNQIVSDEESILTAFDYDACKRPNFLAEGDEIVLGFDGGRTHDATVLIGIRVSDKAIFRLGTWWNQDPANQPHWEVPRPEVDGMVDYAFSQYNVVAFFADVARWESYIDSWSDKYRDRLVVKATPISTVGYDMSGHREELTKANERLVAGFIDQYYSHDGDTLLRSHVLNTRKFFTKYGMYFTKESRESSKHNDGWAATLLASLALTKFLESGRRPEKKRSGRVHMF
jgi:phage terminase large subunit-like protein